MELTERFLRYASCDTQSYEATGGQCPSTAGQLEFARSLRDELLAIGLGDAAVDEHGYVYASLPQNSGKTVPPIGFIAHLDTSPDCCGAGVRPRLIMGYDGSDIVLDADRNIVTSTLLFPELMAHVGEDLIVTDGSTLLGADDKAGIAEIVTAMTHLLSHPEVKHGRVGVAFTPDEEIGRGAELFDVERFGCQWAYTVDGGEAGELEYENFNAAQARVVIRGRGVHPGYAKGKMVNACAVACELASALPADERPECTEGYEGFYHLFAMRGGVEEMELCYIIRDHDRNFFKNRKQMVADAARWLNDKYGQGTVEVTVSDQYYNMLSQLCDKPHITDIAKEAIERACGVCRVRPIRGGTDGAQLSFRGLPCPNIFTGGLFFHGRHELVSVQSMEKAVQTIVNICSITEERA